MSIRSSLRLAHLLIASSLLFSACGDASESCPEASHLDPQYATLELGQGVVTHEELRDGDTLDVYMGAQNLVMFAFTLEVSGIEVPENPLNYTDEKAPKIDIGVDIPGFEIENGYFAYLESFPLALRTEAGPDGEPQYRAIYVPLIFPDHIEPEDVFGSEATLHARVRPASGPSLSVEHHLIVGDEMLDE